MKPFAIAPPLKVGISRADVENRNVGGAMGAAANTTAIGGAQATKGETGLWRLPVAFYEPVADLLRDY